MTSTPRIRDRTTRPAALVHTAWAEGLDHDEFRDDQNFPDAGGHDMPFSLEVWTEQLFAAAAVVPHCTLPFGTPRPWLYVLEAH